MSSEPSSPLRKLPFMTSNKPNYTPNDQFKFQIGVNFKAKLIGIEDVPEARGDRMCQQVIQKQKDFIKDIGAHKQPIHVNVSLEGIKLVDLRTGQTLHHHPVQRISFISRDVSDARAFGYIYGPGDGKHKFFGIKTEKAAENLVLTLRDLFQVVFQMKKKEAEEERKKGLDIKEHKTEAKEESIGEEKQEEEAKPAEIQQQSSLVDLESLGFDQSMPSASSELFNPESGVGGGVVITKQALAAQNNFPGNDVFGTQQATNVQPDVTSQQQQQSWATFNNPQAASSFNPAPATQPQFNAQTQPSMGAFGSSSMFAEQAAAPAVDPFRTAAFDTSGSTGMGGMNWGGIQQQPSQPQPSNVLPANNPFAAPAATVGMFGAPMNTAMPATDSAFGSAFGGVTMTPQSIPPAPLDNSLASPNPPKREDMFSGLVDSFGVDFGKKKEEAPAKSMNQLVTSQSPFGVSEGEIEKSTNNEFVSGSNGFEAQINSNDPFYASSASSEIKKNEMEIAPNVFTKTISFSESENDLTPDKDVPAPTLPPPPLPSFVNKNKLPDDIAPIPPPRPNVNKNKTDLPEKISFNSIYCNQNQITLNASVYATLPRMTHPITRGLTVDLGNLPDLAPPPPPPRPGAKAASSIAAQPQVSASCAQESLTQPSVPLRENIQYSPTLARSKRSPHNSPSLSRHIMTQALEAKTAANFSPKLDKKTIVADSFGNEAGGFTDNFADINFRSDEVNKSADSNNACDVATSNFGLSFADFSNFTEHVSAKGENGNQEEVPPPPPPRPATGRLKAPKLNSANRALTMPNTDSTVTDLPNDVKSKTASMSEDPSNKSKTVDPFSLNMNSLNRTVNSQYARPRPKARSKTPTLISTKTNLSMVVKSERSDSPLSQNSSVSRQDSTCSREVESFANFENLNISGGSGSFKQKPEVFFDNKNSIASSLQETRSRCDSQSQRTGTPVSMNSVGDTVIDPFAHVDPFETNKQSDDPFSEKDPFDGTDPFQNGTDPFDKDLKESEFKTKIIAVTIDGLEASEASSDSSKTTTDLKISPDPFGSDPFSSLVSDPFHSDSNRGLDQPMLDTSQKRRSYDPFDTAHATNALIKSSITPEFSNTFDCGIVANSTGNSKMFADFSSEFPAVSNNENSFASQIQNKACGNDFSKNQTFTNDNQNESYQFTTNFSDESFSSTSRAISNTQTNSAHNSPAISRKNQSPIVSRNMNTCEQSTVVNSFPNDAKFSNIEASKADAKRVRHESATSYNSEISEAFLSSPRSSSQTPTIYSHSTNVNNDRGTPNNPFSNPNEQPNWIQF